MRQLSHRDRIEELTLRDIEYLDAVVSGIGDVQLAACFVEREILKALIGSCCWALLIRRGRIVASGGKWIVQAALIRTAVVNINPDVVRDIDRQEHPGLYELPQSG